MSSTLPFFARISPTHFTCSCVRRLWCLPEGAARIGHRWGAELPDHAFLSMPDTVTPDQRQPHLPPTSFSELCIHSLVRLCR